MGGDKRFGDQARLTSRGFAFAMICLAALAAGCSKSDKETDNGVFDTSRLPRVSGAKEVFASPTSTIFTSPDLGRADRRDRRQGARRRRLAEIHRSAHRLQPG